VEASGQVIHFLPCHLVQAGVDAGVRSWSGGLIDLMMGSPDILSVEAMVLDRSLKQLLRVMRAGGWGGPGFCAVLDVCVERLPWLV
jgi:hypothetical protein